MALWRQNREPADSMEMRMRGLSIVFALALLAAVPLSRAADASPPKATVADPLASARELVKARRWPEAQAELRRVNATGNADWQNLMGYVARKTTPPDLDAAERHYLEALRIDPRHRGALEYSGELYLMKGDLARAEAQLAVLDKACLFGCEEYTDLKNAVARYKAAGRWTPE
jgi:Flp pilus assembly protein TadD